MPTFSIPFEQYSEDGIHPCVPKVAFDKFGTQTLGLGDISAAATATDAIAAMFDLEGFTNFSKQIEPHLSIPLYLHAFLTWLMEEIREVVAKEHKAEKVLLWAPLPFFVKFMGDGLLVLWDCGHINDGGRRNIVRNCHSICEAYVGQFLSTVGDKIVDPPPRLRCGVARGTVLSVGDGQDYVGSCINMAARLQKLPGISFCFNRRGFDLEEKSVAKFFKQDMVTKQVSVRGIGEHELVAILQREFDALPPRDRKLYKAP